MKSWTVEDNYSRWGNSAKGLKEENEAPEKPIEALEAEKIDKKLIKFKEKRRGNA